MRSSLLGLVLVGTSVVAQAKAPKICVASENSKIGYASKMSYDIKCNDGKSYDSEAIVTSFILPLPYNWKSSSKEKLKDTMDKLNMREVARFKNAYPQNSFEKDLIVYSSEIYPAAGYCLISKAGRSSVGLEAKKEVWNLKAACDSKSSFINIDYTGITNDDVKTVLAREGLVKTGISSVNLEGLGVTDLYQAR